MYNLRSWHISHFSLPVLPAVAGYSIRFLPLLSEKIRTALKNEGYITASRQLFITADEPIVGRLEMVYVDF